MHRLWERKTLYRKLQSKEESWRKKLGQEDYWLPQMTCIKYIPTDCRATSGMSSFITQHRNATDTDRSTKYIGTPTAKRTKTPELGHENWCNHHINNDTHWVPTVPVANSIHRITNYGWKPSCILLMAQLHIYLHWHPVCTIITLSWKEILQLEHNPLHQMFH